ncbi:orotate phosphoribosyltransferase [Rohdeia mirabilis]|uniref:orotate phosphoribosyltransferase n=1 Tax=Rohdeia mirabilis TaxID=2528008 RepID=UPI003AF356D4
MSGNDVLGSGEVLDLLRRENALLEGHFLLSSGLHSDRYFQCALALCDPRSAGQLANALVARLAAEGLEYDLVVGPALGAVVWAQEVARAAGTKSFFTERKGEKGAGMALRRGFVIAPGTRCLVVEDVVTTGGSAKEVIDLLNEIGAKVVAVGSVVNRSGGNPFADLGLPLVALAEVTARTWAPSDPPEGFENSTPIKPGSRA